MPRSPVRARCLLFWDYDTQWGVERSRLGNRSPEIGMREFACTERILEVLAQRRLGACFAVVGAAALRGPRPYHDPMQVRAIHAAGHEVASHAFRHEWLPGLDAAGLRETLLRSREALEQCIGAPVVTFVPPWNQPRDYPARLAISWSERREAPRHRVDLPALCRALEATGYRACRVAYRPATVHLAERVYGRSRVAPMRPVRIGGIVALRLNAGCGFGRSADQAVDRCIRRGGLAVIYAHPHSLVGDDAQNEAHLVPFLDRLASLRDRGLVEVGLPRDLAAAG